MQTTANSPVMMLALHATIHVTHFGPCRLRDMLNWHRKAGVQTKGLVKLAQKSQSANKYQPKCRLLASAPYTKSLVTSPYAKSPVTSLEYQGNLVR